MTVFSLIFVLVLIPAGIGYCLYIEHLARELSPSRFAFFRDHLHHFFHPDIEPGDFLIYRKSKASPHPGPRARNVHASENGDDYYYDVDKYWTVADVLDDGRLLVVTRTGKQVFLAPEDENLRKPGWLERLRYRSRFPSV